MLFRSDKFLKSSGYASQFEGLQVGTKEFDSKWKELAKSDEFADAQRKHAVKEHYDPQMKKLQKAGIDLSQHGAGVQEALMSTANQYGAHLHLRHDSYIGMGGWSASSWRWYTHLSSGDMTAAGNITAYSDPRLKEEIVPVTNALEKIKQLNGVRFKWIESSVIGHPGEYDYGILSCDVEKIAPELVIDSIFDAPEGDRYKTVAYDKLIAFAIEAIKEQQKQIEEQQTQIDELRKLINVQ